MRRFEPIGGIPAQVEQPIDTEAEARRVAHAADEMPILSNHVDASLLADDPALD